MAALDVVRTRHRCAPRNPKSASSAVNKETVGRMRAGGRMAPAGEAAVAAAIDNGMWNLLDDVERPDVRADLASALGPMREVWDAWPRSVRRGALEWIKMAKAAATRARRIADVPRSANDGLRPTSFHR